MLALSLSKGFVPVGKTKGFDALSPNGQRVRGGAVRIVDFTCPELVHNGEWTGQIKEDAMVTPQENPVDRRFNAVLNRHLVAFYTIRRAHDRYHGLVNNAIEANRQGAREWSEVGRGWLRRPTDIARLLDGAVEATANAQARSVALVQEWLDGMRDLQR